MCGIVGVLQYKSEVPDDVRERALRILFSEALIKTETRGEDATGVYQVHSDGDWMMTKKGVKSSEWAYTRANDEDHMVYQDLMDTWSAHASPMTALVGHCRKATVGSKGADNNDNHPFAIQVDEKNALLGIHNGTLDNHEIIIDKLPDGLERQGQTDSEIIFHFMHHLTRQGQDPITGDMIREMARRLDGAYACIAVNSLFPNIVGTFRESRPMEYYMISPLNIVLIVSEKRFAQSALDRYQFFREFMDPTLPALEYDDRALAERDWRVFDTSLPFPEGKPTFQDLNKISDHGEIRKTHEKVPDDWKKSYKSSTTTSSTTGGTKTGVTTKPATTTPIKPVTSTSPNTTAAVTARASKKDDKITVPEADSDEGVVVEGEVVEMDLADVVPKKTLERVKSLGLCTHYDSDDEINKSLALPAGESVTDMSPVEVANAVAKLHFAMGYATSGFDNKAERVEARAKSRDLLPKLEKAEEKKTKAEQHIWEHKQLLVFMVALAAEGYDLDMKNVAISLSAFKEVSGKRRAGIMEAARKLFTDDGTKKLIRKLRDEYRKAEDRDVRRKTRESSEQKDEGTTVDLKTEDAS